MYRRADAVSLAEADLAVILWRKFEFLHFLLEI